MYSDVQELYLISPFRRQGGLPDQGRTERAGAAAGQRNGASSHFW